MIKCNKTIAQKFLLFKQFLFPPREITGMKGIEKVFNGLRTLQYDPQNPCGRNTDILLQARVGNIHPNDYYHWLYKQRKGIEVYDKELSVVPIEDLLLCRGKFPLSRERKLSGFLKSDEKKLRQLIKFIDKNGPICSNDIDENERVDIFWESARWSRVALDSLWKIGKLVISHRKNGRKHYDLPHNIYGDKFAWKNKKFKNKLQDECVIRRIKNVGMLPVSGTGSGWLGVGIGKEIAPVISKLIQQKKLVEIEISESKNHYVINSSDLDLISRLEKENPNMKISFLSPLDNLLWDRKMIRDIFGFDYKWETYTPADARQYGHYVLPILFGLEFIGRIEPKYNEKDGILEIKGFWIEPNYKWNNDTSRAFWKYLEEFKNYLQAKSIKWSCKAPKK